MAHITFIHGIANKPLKEDLLRIWRDGLNSGDEPLPLGDYGVTSSMVYWADVLYEKPDTSVSSYEGVLENTAEAIDGAGDAEIPKPSTDEEAEFIRRLRSHLTSLSDEEIDHEQESPLPEGEQEGLERIPLPWAIKKRFMKAFLRDVHHYLFDVEHTPRPGETYRVQQAVRQRFLDAINDPGVTRPHIVISHSMGTVIAYDCLKRVADCPQVDGLVTLGSPLGMDEIQDKLKPGWSRNDGFPFESVSDAWLNVFDRLDPVCGFDPVFKNDFRLAGESRVLDESVNNGGIWRHTSTKYLGQGDLQRGLRKMLGL